jgi:DNA-3-methyladenine glycosylase I
MNILTTLFYNFYLKNILLYHSLKMGIGIILNKRENYRKLFDDFNIVKVAKYDIKKQDSLVKNPEIIRNNLKIKAIISNAKIFLEIQKEFGSFSNYFWSFSKNKTINIERNKYSFESSHNLSKKIFKDLRSKGISFIGATTIHSFIQAAGMVDSHEFSCFLNLVPKSIPK